ncbi:transcriptional activator, Rgg/GadR/MutR family domain-containing protein [Enterococcus moraviensis ATCC BAA-383]|uniref:Transcriptional activator, Rgg/GadR/MutR family domain-containing protein n=1 Tax=Enterococcus moraviensis ATCC BAA-383 TaxID=1158609 RepID=R2RCL2_9ENTE|nr:transcriptional activator, Rgg/GadR/MutR family domain-containing protein [Enterococcus moraviensis ATCC BAA-383]EOT65102.1 hypothetical protein I586_02836 [Enterococcus moraviensis ATCC BAA-383]OJG66948.1 transcriptional activator, Rgg/GadR/MutR family domain-containing protein [Enterococcus moraviensis]
MIPVKKQVKLTLGGADELKNYGLTIRQIRLNKGYRQKEVYNEIITKSYAIEFEQGKHDISLFLFRQILDRLRVDIDEFFYIHNEYHLQEENDYINNFSHAANRHDIQALEKMYQTQLHHTKPTALTLVRQAELRLRIQSLTYFEHHKTFENWQSNPKDIQILSSYLMDVQSWTLQEILLFSNNADMFNQEQQIFFFKLLLKSLPHYRSYDRAVPIYGALLANILPTLFRKQEWADISQALDWLEELSKEFINSFFRIMFIYYSGLFAICQGDAIAGEKKVHWALNTLKILDQADIAVELDAFFTTFKGQENG